MAKLKVEMVKDERETVELASANLAELKGIHTVHTDIGMFVFKNGKANVLKVNAEVLRKEGIIK